MGWVFHRRVRGRTWLNVGSHGHATVSHRVGRFTVHSSGAVTVHPVRRRARRRGKR